MSNLFDLSSQFKQNAKRTKPKPSVNQVIWVDFKSQQVVKTITEEDNLVTIDHPRFFSYDDDDSAPLFI